MGRRIWWVAGFALAVVLAGAAACGLKGPCNAANCPGCCDASGACQGGSTANACGLDGNGCVECAATQACQIGVCTLVSGSSCATGSCPDGGGGGGGGASGNRADGTLGAWAVVTPMPVPRANHCSAAAGQFLLVAGGNYKPAGGSSFVSVDDIHSASVAEDGTLGAWTLAGKLPSPGTDCVLAVSGTTVVLLGGLFDTAALDGDVWTTTLALNGTLGTWQLVGTLPYGRRALGVGAETKAGKVLLSDAALVSETNEAVLALATLGNPLGSWTKTQYWPQFRGKPSLAFTDAAAFFLGGYDGTNAVLSDVTGIPLDADGAPGTPVATTALPAGRTFGAAAGADDYVFNFGGRDQLFGVAPQANVISAKASGASLGPWTAQAPLPEPRSNHTATVVGDFVFILGGGNNGPGLDAVYRAQIRHPVH